MSESRALFRVRFLLPPLPPPLHPDLRTKNNFSISHPPVIWCFSLSVVCFAPLFLARRHERFSHDLVAGGGPANRKTIRNSTAPSRNVLPEMLCWLAAAAARPLYTTIIAPLTFRRPLIPALVLPPFFLLNPTRVGVGVFVRDF